MDEEVFEKYMKAGEIAARVKNDVLNRVRPGMRLIDIARFVEDRIRALGGQLAFPCNLSVDSTAAHYTPEPLDTDVVEESSVLKMDLGVHVDGYIADTALTISFDPQNEPLIEATRRTLDEALRSIRPGLSFYKLGGVIEDTARSYGYNTIKNLSGHSLGHYQIHAGEVIPNHRDRLTRGSFRDGGAYAIEPFLTPGIGLVADSDRVTIYALRPRGKLRRLSEEERRLFERILGERRALPFTLRWYAEGPEEYYRLKEVVEGLARRGYAIEYPVLVEVSGERVAQFEETVVIYRGVVYVTTRSGYS